MGEGDPTGGSLELARLIDRYGEFLLPELKHYFGIDLRDLFSEAPPFSPRYILSHINWLPLGSAFVAETRGGQQFRGWDGDRYIQVALINALRTLIHVFILANKDPKKKAPEAPQPYPTPDEKSTPRSAKPGSFAFIANAGLAATKKRKGTG